MRLGPILSPQTLGRIAWIGFIGGGAASLLANLLHLPIVGWAGLVLIGAEFVAM